jgi:tRNA pseudouridine55 synthase
MEGLLLVHKPPGMTSHDVVDVVRRKLGTRRIGHTGTLDPMAEGLLILLIGPATKQQQALANIGGRPRVTSGCDLNTVR